MNIFPFLVEREAGGGSGSVFQSHPRWMLINLHRLFFFFLSGKQTCFSLLQSAILWTRKASPATRCCRLFVGGSRIRAEGKQASRAWITVIQDQLTSTTPLVTMFPPITGHALCLPVTGDSWPFPSLITRIK